MTNIEKMNEMLTKEPEMEKKVSAEIVRISEAMEKKNPKAAFAQAAKTVLDIDFTEDELNELFPKVLELTDSDIEKVSSGTVGGALLGGFIGGIAGVAVGSVAGPVGAVVVGALGLGLGAYVGNYESNLNSQTA